MTDTAMLDRIVVRVSDDDAKYDPELVCDDCGEHLCDVEHADTLAVLVRVAQGHLSKCPGERADEDECRDCGETLDDGEGWDDGGAFDRLCDECADSQGIPRADTPLLLSAGVGR